MKAAIFGVSLSAAATLSGAAFAQAGIALPMAKPDFPFAADVLDTIVTGEAEAPLVIAPPISYDPLSGYQGLSLTPTFGSNALSYAPGIASDSLFPEEATNLTTLYLVAKLAEGMPNLSKGLRWHVFEELTNGDLREVSNVEDSDGEFRLEPGSYLVHTAFGNVTATTRYTLKSGITTGTIVLNAGGIRLDAAFADEMSMDKKDVAFDIYQLTYDSTGNRTRVASNVRVGELTPVAAGTYHIVSRYGDVNAVVRAEIHVQAGKMTEATLYHRAGDVTLKLVSGEDKISLANTAWTVLTQSGDKIASGNGAFLDLTLAEGTYKVLAQNSGLTYEHSFSVTNGDRDVEVEIEAVNPL
nr:hypothetical protein [Pseudovibrio flavus]